TFSLTGNSSADELIVGNSGIGNLNVGAGAQLNVNSINGHMELGIQPGSTGTVTVSGSGAIATVGAFILVGRDGTGTFNVTNGGRITVNTVFGG
ncbi:hypothetical protein, partial [Salmonella sp. SAL4455]|uniref:hypothetical protein n=1 Tax=Salmonella sp. SAL4455 TaxID=3159910 RepID=UPI00397D0E93